MAVDPRTMYHRVMNMWPVQRKAMDTQIVHLKVMDTQTVHLKAMDTQTVQYKASNQKVNRTVTVIVNTTSVI